MSAKRLYLLDVEGTVAPISLVTEQLFPYARAHFEAFLRQSVAEVERKGEAVEPSDVGEGSVLWDLAMLRRENRAESDPEVPQILPDSLAELGFKGDPESASMRPALGNPAHSGVHLLAHGSRSQIDRAEEPAGQDLEGRVRERRVEGHLVRRCAGRLQTMVDGCARCDLLVGFGGGAEAACFATRFSAILTPLICRLFRYPHRREDGQSASYAAIAAAMNVPPG